MDNSKIITTSGKQVGLLMDFEDYKELLEEEYDTMCYERAMADKTPAIPFEQAIEEIQRGEVKDG